MKLYLSFGTTSVILHIFIQDAASSTGSGLTGVAYNSSNIAGRWIRSGETNTSLSFADISTLGTWAAPGTNTIGLKEISSANMPGWYEIHLPDAFLATSGSSSCHSLGIQVRGVTNMVPINIEIELTSVLPSAAAGASGGLPTVDANNAVKLQSGTGSNQISLSSGAVIVQSGTGTGQLDFTSGVVKANITQCGGSTVAAGAIPNAAAAANGGLPTVDANNAVKLQSGTGSNQISLSSGAVIVQSGTSTGQLDLSSGQVKVQNGTSSGQIKATGGYPGINWGDVSNPTTTVGLTGTTISTSQAVASVSGAVGSVTGNVGGNVTGSVGSVVGAVGSVTGNVGGNVTGSVGSVVGAVGSVTGNVGGNVTGSVGSVASDVTVSSGTGTGQIDLSSGQVKVQSGTGSGQLSVTSGVISSTIATNGIAAASFAADAKIYYAEIEFTRDQANTKDEYTVTWFKDGTRVTSSITSPTIQVVKRSDGTDLVASTAMTQIGSTGSYKYDENTNRITLGEAVLVVASATIDAGSRSYSRLIGRDSS